MVGSDCQTAGQDANRDSTRRARQGEALAGSLAPRDSHGPWVCVGGGLDYDAANLSNCNLDTDIKNSILWPCCGKNAAIFKCPSDKSAVNVRGQVMPRVRTMSMLNWVGGRGEDRPMNWSNNEYSIYRCSSDFRDPGPTRTFVFLDEREDSINDGTFVVDMLVYPTTTQSMVDYPASYHGGAGGFSLADGHSELKKWTTPRILELPLKGEVRPYPTPSGGEFNKDVLWKQERATRHL